MLSVLRSQLRKGEKIAAVEYRNLAPLYVGEPMTVCMRQIPARMVDGAKSERLEWDVWVEDKNGGLSARATVKGAVSQFPN
jgi:hydroxyacyl-ACP dehydratase HTD2-like protein with hotdog domain